MRLRYFAASLASLAVVCMALPAFADVLPYPSSTIDDTVSQHVRPFQSSTSFKLMVLATLILTILLELPIMYWFGWRSRRAVSTIIAANVASFLFLQITTISFGASVLLMEIAVVIIEFVIIKLALKEKRTGRLWWALIVANVFSALVGTLTLTALGLR